MKLKLIDQILVNPNKYMILLISLVPFGLLFWHTFFDLSVNFPTDDSVYRASRIAILTADGELKIGDLIEPVLGHITFFSYGITAITTYVTNWDYRYEVWLNFFFTILIFFGALHLIHITAPNLPRYLWVVSIPLSMAVFTIRQSIVISTGYASAWFFLVIFTFSVVILLHKQRKIWMFGLAVILAGFATISVAAGATAWLAGFICILFGKYNSLRIRITYIVLWLIALSGAALSLIQMDIMTSTYELNISLLHMRSFRWAIYILGSVIDGTHTPRGGVIFGLVGLFMFAINLLYIYRKDRDSTHHMLAIWFPILFSTYILAFLTAFGRFEHYGITLERFQDFTYGFYSTFVMPFWIAIVATGAWIIAYNFSKTENKLVDIFASYSNLLIAVIIGASYIPASTIYFTYNSNVARCLEERVFRQQLIPLGCWVEENTPITFYNQMAERQLSMYSNLETTNLVRDATEPVLVEGKSPWVNVLIRRYYLNGLSEDNILNVFPQSDIDFSFMQNRPTNVYLGDSPSEVENLLDQLQTQEKIWYIHVIDESTPFPELWYQLQELGYIIVNTTQSRWVLMHEVVSIETLAENSALFQDNIRLMGVTNLSNTITPCESLSVQTMWTAENEHIDTDYSVSLKLLNTDGQQYANTDAALSDIDTSNWRIGAYYLDERVLNVPCDLPSGDYWLAITVYFYQAPNDPLPVEGDILPIFEDMALVKTMSVRE